MDLFNKLKRYKAALQITFCVNVFFILTGVWGLFNFLQWRDFGYGFLALVGGGTLVFGILVPLMLIRKIGMALNKAKHQITNQGAEFIAHWVNSRSLESRPYTSPRFWTDLLLFGAEMSASPKTPLGSIIKELAPAVRQELRRSPAKTKAPSKKKGSKKRAA